MRPVRIGAALLLSLGLAVTACSADQPGQAPTPTSVPASAAEPTPTLDPGWLIPAKRADGTQVTVDMHEVLGAVRSAFGLNFGYRLVPKGAAVPCTISQKDTTVDGDVPGSFWLCTGQNYYAFPAAVADQNGLGGKSPAVIWYTFASRAAGTVTEPAFDLPAEQQCAGGFIAARSPGFSAAELTAMAEYLSAELGPSAVINAAKGVEAQAQQKSIYLCAGEG